MYQVLWKWCWVSGVYKEVKILFYYEIWLFLLSNLCHIVFSQILNCTSYCEIEGPILYKDIGFYIYAYKVPTFNLIHGTHEFYLFKGCKILGCDIIYKFK
jgi:hypothetical protein